MRLIAFLLVFNLFCGSLASKEYDNILLFKNCGTWKSNALLIKNGQDAGRIAWNGKLLRFTPRGSSFDLKDTYCFGFAIRVPKEMENKRITVTFVYESGKAVIWNVKTPDHIGWQGDCLKIQPQKPSLRKGKIKAVEFSTQIQGFQAVLDDIRWVPDGLNFQFEEANVPPVCNDCFFPEYTLKQQRQETLNDPKFKEKMAEIERLRQSKLKIHLKRQHTKPDEVYGDALLARIREDGSVDGLLYDEVKKLHKQERWWHDVNETYMEKHSDFYRKVLSVWEWGRASRTKANRKKLFRSFVRTLTAESNRRAECFHYIVPAFVFPVTAVNIYRLFFDEMEAVENGTNHDPDTILLNRLLKEIISRCYTYTFYNTVGPALTPESFSRSSNWTGGNFSYRPTFMAALVCRNPKMLDVISEVAKRSLVQTSFNTVKTSFWTDAMTADGSAWGHGNQNYPFRYPLSGVQGIGSIIGNLAGTSWELQTDGPVFDTLCGYMESLLWHGTTWVKNPDKNYRANEFLQRDIPVACGRSGQRYFEGKGYADFTLAYQTVNVYLKFMPSGSSQRERLQYCADVMSGKVKQLPVGTRYFWNNDLLLCREKDSIAAVSMLSSRVLGMEAAASHSKLTDFWPDGAAWVMKHFDSYRVARGFMKPCAIPGVTARQWTFTHEGQDWRSYTGKYNFAGGATDGNYAVCGYHMGRKNHHASHDPNFYNLTARKAYFWLNGKLVCIGAGITDEANHGIPVATTIDQTLWRGPAVYTAGTTKQPGEKFQVTSQLLWHDGVGYWIMHGKGFLSGETKKEHWSEIDLNNKKIRNLPQTASMLMFQIDHGKNVKNRTYAYAVDFHCNSFTDLQKEVKAPSFELLSMTPEIQALREKSSGTLAAVFYKPGEIGGLKVNVPAVILLRKTDKGTWITVNDPKQDSNLKSMKIRWKNKTHEISLPAGVYCGKPVTVNLAEIKP